MNLAVFSIFLATDCCIVILMATVTMQIEEQTQISLRKRLKRVFKPTDPDKLEVVIMEIWDVKKGEHWDVKYVISFGGKKSITIYGDDWNRFTELVSEIEFFAETTQEIPMVQKEPMD